MDKSLKKHKGYNPFGMVEGSRKLCLHCNESFIYGEHDLFLSSYGYLYEYCPFDGCDGTLIDFLEYSHSKHAFFTNRETGSIDSTILDKMSQSEYDNWLNKQPLRNR